MTGSLARRLGTGDAVVIGLGSMVGAGIFSAFGPAASAAGSALLAGLALAGGIAYCNAVASAQLAAQYPTSGGTYVYGRERLGEWWGFAAGWAFVVGKTASCAAMALTFAVYAIPSSTWVQRVVAVAAVLALTALNYRGISRTAQATRLLVGVSLACLLVAVFAIATSGETDASRLGHWPSLGAGGLHGVLQAAGFLFFAFAGYARIATMGEEVRDPARTIPRAIPIALGIALALYVAVGVAALAGAGPAALAASTKPLATAVDAVGSGWALPFVRVDEPRDGAQRRSAPLPRLRASELPGAGPRRACRRCGRCRCRRRERPPQRDRVLLIRRAPLLRDRECVGVHAGHGTAALAQSAQRDRLHRLRRPGRGASAVGDRRRFGRSRGRARGPSGRHRR